MEVRRQRGRRFVPQISIAGREITKVLCLIEKSGATLNRALNLNSSNETLESSALGQKIF